MLHIVGECRLAIIINRPECWINICIVVDSIEFLVVLRLSWIINTATYHTRSRSACLRNWARVWVSEAENELLWEKEKKRQPKIRMLMNSFSQLPLLARIGCACRYAYWCRDLILEIKSTTFNFGCRRNDILITTCQRNQPSLQL